MVTADAYVYDLNSISVPSANAYANFQSGSNGAPGDAPEYAVGSGGSETDGRTQWDTGDSGGIDSGSVSFTFTANASGTTLTLANSITGTITTAGVSSFSSISIIAGVQNYAAVAFGGLSVTFYDSTNTAISDYGALNGPQVDMTDPSSGGVGEEVMTLTPPPSAGTVASVVITGQIQLTALDGEYPAADDLFGTIAIN